MQLSSFLQRFNEPETLKMAKLGRELRAKGVDVIDLSLGEPDFDTPEIIKQAEEQKQDLFDLIFYMAKQNGYKIVVEGKELQPIQNLKN